MTLTYDIDWHVCVFIIFVMEEKSHLKNLQWSGEGAGCENESIFLLLLLLLQLS